MQASLMSVFLLVIVTSMVGSEAAQTERFDVTTFITSRFAETTITSVVRNDGNLSQEIQFQSLLPGEAFISGFSMTINGVTYESTVLEKEKAKKKFRAAKRLHKTAGLVETRETSTKTFKTSVNVAGGEVVEFNLVYQQLLRRLKGKYRHQVILLGNQMADFLTIQTHICESQPIRKVETLPILNSEGERVSPKVSIDLQRNYASVNFLRGVNDELLKSLSSSGGSFETQYELEPANENGAIVLDQGYFVYFYAPDIVIPPRRVIFVLDKSGSMSGTRIKQLIESMVYIVDKLTPEDRFAIIAFDDDAIVYKGGSAPLSAGTNDNIKSAKRFLQNLNAGGGTNIDAGLQAALTIMDREMKNEQDAKTSSYIVFLTDGLPSVGFGRDQVLRRLDRKNVNDIPIHAIGLGDGVDAEFLQSITAKNNGTWTQIFEDIKAALQIQNYLDELGSNLLQNLVIKYPQTIVDDFVMQPVNQFLEGGEIIAFGKLKDDIDSTNRGPHFLQLSGGNISVSAEFFLDQRSTQCAALEGQSVAEFGNKAFGLAKVLEILRQYHAETNTTAKQELRLQAIEMSIFYKLVTSVTSLLVIKPEDMEEVDKELKEGKTTVPVQATSSTVSTTPPLSPTLPPTTTTPPSRKPAWSVQGDPHVVLHLTDNITACFNWKGNSGEAFNLINDPQNDIVINGLMDGPISKSSNSKANYITKLVVLLKRQHLVIKINPTRIVVKDTSNKKTRQQPLNLPILNMENFRTTYGPLVFEINGQKSGRTVLRVILANDITFVVNLFHYYHKHRNDVFRHLDLVFDASERFSTNVGGIFGRLPRNPASGEAPVSIEESEDNTYLWFNDMVTSVKKRTMMIPLIHERVECWFVRKPAVILGAPLEDFKVKTLMEIPIAAY